MKRHPATGTKAVPSQAMTEIARTHDQQPLRDALRALSAAAALLRVPDGRCAECAPVHLIEVEFDGCAGVGEIPEIRLVDADWRQIPPDRSAALLRMKPEAPDEAGDADIGRIVKLAVRTVLETRRIAWEFEEGGSGTMEFRLQMQADGSVLPLIAGHAALRELVARAEAL